MRNFLLIFLLLFAANTCSAEGIPQKKVKHPAVLKLDSTKVKVRTMDATAIERYSKEREFIYDDAAPAKLSLLDRFWRWFWDMIQRIFSGGVVGGIVKYILIGLAIAIVAFVVIKLIGVDFKLLLGKSKSVALPYEETLENIHEIDFESQLEQAIRNKDYRLAVRLLYLRTLKQLTDRQLIDWRVEKTNQMYVSEFANETYKPIFNNLTNQFEFIWYGEFHIDKDSFEPIQESFNQFTRKAL